MIPWRVAKSLDKLLVQINIFAPHRSKVADGSIGDAEHAARTSDHNPWIDDPSSPLNVVSARDYTHDPVGGFDAYKFADVLKLHDDKRIKYVISNRRIWNPSVSSDWRPYGGSNPHTHHTHVSVKSDKPDYDDVIDVWNLAGINVSNPAPSHSVSLPRLKLGARGASVIRLQHLLNVKGIVVDADGEFGHTTEMAVMQFQAKHPALKADGIVGPYTWDALNGTETT